MPPHISQLEMDFVNGVLARSRMAHSNGHAMVPPRIMEDYVDQILARCRADLSNAESQSSSLLAEVIQTAQDDGESMPLSDTEAG
jgi:hypothetical protein